MKTETQRPLDSIESAIQDLKLGKMIIVVDDEDRENEGDFIMPAETITAEAVNFMITHGRGLLCAPVTQEIAKRLELPLQVQSNTDSMGTAFTVTIDAKIKGSTGISASDRARTLNIMTSPETEASAFTRPGHIFPLIAKNGGVLERTGHTEAAVDFSRLAGFAPVGAICEIMNEDGSMSRLPDLFKLADKHNLKVVSIADLVEYRKRHENLISSVESIPFPNKFGEFQMFIFHSELLKQEHVAIVKGDLEKLKKDPTLLRVHSECFTGDIFGSYRCDCGDQLNNSMKMIEENGSGLVVYLRQEGRGIGLFNKVKAYQLQDQGMDTAEANLHLGFPVDSRDYTMAAQILRYFNVSDIKLLTNNPQKIEGLSKLGFSKIQRVPLEINANQKNAQYLLTKKTKLGHLLKQNLLNQ
ncbi:bifunctional 3,4-dihydroxy-2-butanone-4-phosphate synthase/GTP cyclohydrolase II [Peredibacter starrii]|uniref:Riboflavin biosynthesis protein RibBA n=1 Tax=Peredibacter starrii TaxID=28202 RepID=A0AAX4HKT7_9BACT|nr:bifunctional 3,4-dihydroxy-2-butanone-4-phosphate synthase/GTP cyclohydrolase II [Peredibacter starrii]WPU63797.1 bifunctional 3,4-dihydroxy-2-butanone-4-phosphate synthase/GTP cyclohydrolase II [Peredibacter starrii]